MWKWSWRIFLEGKKMFARSIMRIMVKRKFCKRNWTFCNKKKWWQERSCVWVIVLLWIVQFCSEKWKGEVFLGINRSTFLFRRVKWQLVNLWSIPFKRKKNRISSFVLAGGVKWRRGIKKTFFFWIYCVCDEWRGSVGIGCW